MSALAVLSAAAIAIIAAPTALAAPATHACAVRASTVQDASPPPQPPAYTEADFKTDRAVVNEALASSASLVGKGDFEAAVGALDAAISAVRPASLRATLWLTRANVHQVEGKLSLASDDLDRADELLSGIDAATHRRERSAQLASYSCSQRSKLYLDWGLVDRALHWVTKAKALLPPRAPAQAGGAVHPPSSDFDRERILANYVEALVLSSMDDWDALERAVDAALADEVYARFPGQRSRLRARLGLALRESARTAPAVAIRARALLEEALADPAFVGMDRLLPELALGELDLSARSLSAAEAHCAAAAAILGPAEARASLPGHTAWLAFGARLAVDRDDRPASEAELAALRDELASALEARVAEWRRRELRAGGYGHLHYGDQQSLLSELMRLDLALDPAPAGTTLALARLLSAETASTLARKLGAEPVELASARTALLGDDEQRALLLYFPSPDRTHLFVVDGEGTAHFELAPADFVEAARARAERALHRPLPAGAEAWRSRERDDAFAELARELLPERVRARLARRTRWTIVGEDLLGPVPFEALSFDGAYLGATHAIARIPSLAIGVRLVDRARRERRALGSDAAVELFAAPLGSERPLDGAELAEIVARYPAQRRTITRGAQATPASFATALSRARVAQVLAHGHYDESRERPAGMVLAAPDGIATAFLGADEIEMLDAPPLTVLTVCAAARAPKRRGDAGAADLAGAFLAAGARAHCVIQSAFDLDVESAREISLHFHAALAGGDPPAEALRKARAALARDARFADPFHHASIVLVGAGFEALF